MNNYNSKLFNVMGSDVLNAPVLATEEETSLILKAQAGDVEAKDSLIYHNVRLCIQIASEYTGRGVAKEDLVEEGILGLGEAIAKFDVTKGVKFSTYAALWIRQKMGNAVLAHGRTVRLPASQVAKITAINAAKAEFVQEYDREPDSAELAEYMGYEYDASDIGATLASAAYCASLDANLGDSNDAYCLGDTVYDGDELEGSSYASKQEDLAALAAVVSVLNPREREIVLRTYGFNGEEESAAEIAADMGICRERVRQILNSALVKLKKAMACR